MGIHYQKALLMGSKVVILPAQHVEQLMAMYPGQLTLLDERSAGPTEETVEGVLKEFMLVMQEDSSKTIEQVVAELGRERREKIQRERSHWKRPGRQKGKGKRLFHG